MDGEEWSSTYDSAARIARITQVRTELENKENSAEAIHLADMLLQNFQLGTAQHDLLSVAAQKAGFDPLLA